MVSRRQDPSPNEVLVAVTTESEPLQAATDLKRGIPDPNIFAARDVVVSYESHGGDGEGTRAAVVTDLGQVDTLLDPTALVETVDAWSNPQRTPLARGQRDERPIQRGSLPRLSGLWRPGRGQGEVQQGDLASPTLSDGSDADPEETLRFTVWCKERTDRGTVWIDTVEAPNKRTAQVLAIKQCAEDWHMDPDRVRLPGMASGDVDILEWSDLSEP